MNSLNLNFKESLFIVKINKEKLPKFIKIKSLPCTIAKVLAIKVIQN